MPASAVGLIVGHTAPDIGVMTSSSTFPEGPSSRGGVASTAQTPSRARAVWRYDREPQILFVTHPEPVVLATRADMQAYFDDGIRYLREHCPGRRLYVVVDYDNLTTNLDELEFYASQVKRILDECAITVVRYKGSLLQRMAGRMTAIKLHIPSNTYPSREEALEVVRGLRRGAISVEPPSR